MDYFTSLLPASLTGKRRRSPDSDRQGAAKFSRRAERDTSSRPLVIDVDEEGHFADYGVHDQLSETQMAEDTVYSESYHGARHSSERHAPGRRRDRSRNVYREREMHGERDRWREQDDEGREMSRRERRERDIGSSGGGHRPSARQTMPTHETIPLNQHRAILSEATARIQELESHIQGHKMIPLDQHRAILSEATARIQERESHIQGLQHDIQHLQNVSQQKDALLAQTTSLLEVRTTELQGAQTFLTTEDRVSGADVTRMVKDLNEEIFQTAAFMTDSLLDDLNSPGAVGDGAEMQVTADIRQRATVFLGEKMTEKLLGSRSDDDRDVLIQSAIQACAAKCCTSVIRGWGLGLQDGKHLARLYREIQKTEMPSVSGRWRALTRGKSKYALVTSESTNRLASTFVDGISHTLIVAGWPLGVVEARKEVVAKFNARLLGITRMAQQLDKATGEEVISRDLEVYRALEGEPFDHTRMGDAFEENSSRKSQRKSRGTVICTTSLGLRVAAANTPPGGQHATDSGPDILLKAMTIIAKEGASR